MNEQQIHELLRSYFDGTTSLVEERELRRFFAEEEIPDSLKAYRPMFAFFAEEQAVEPPVSKSGGRAVRLIWPIAITGIAASLAVLFLIGLPETHRDDFKYYVDGRRVYDEAAAVQSAENKLQLFAASVQKAKTGMSAFEKVQETGRSLQQFDKASDAFHRMEMMVSGAEIGDKASQ